MRAFTDNPSIHFQRTNRCRDRAREGARRAIQGREERSAAPHARQSGGVSRGSSLGGAFADRIESRDAQALSSVHHLAARSKERMPCSRYIDGFATTFRAHDTLACTSPGLNGLVWASRGLMLKGCQSPQALPPCDCSADLAGFFSSTVIVGTTISGATRPPGCWFPWRWSLAPC